MDLLTSHISASINRHQLIADGDKVIVTLSGGADSVALLSVLVGLGYDCIAAHCNFHLRGDESDRDCAFAQSIAQSLGVECIVKHFDVSKYEHDNKVSTEMACRELRYEWFEQLRQQYAPAVIAVAHHRDDNIETFFLNLLRGTGIAGLTGMAPRNGHIIRPMLDCTRQEVEQYLADKGLDYVTDSTNSQNDYRRNRLRNIILPMLNEQFPGASNAIASTMAMLGDNEAIYREAIDNARNRYVANNTIDLQSLISNELQAATVLFELIRPMGFNYTQACDIIAANSSGRQFFAGNYIITTHRNSLIISHQDSGQVDEYPIDLSQPVNAPINLSVSITPNDGTVAKPSSASTIMLDASVLDGNPLFVLRHWRNGDRIAPFGMNGTKKLSDIFTDAHLSIIDKENVWVLTRNDEILWVIGHRTSRHYPVTPTSTHIITISTNE
jgi:tRNA(Ile)-lysidine synthase